MFKSSYINDNGQAMFILEYLTLFAILYHHQTLGELDGEWRIFLPVLQGNEKPFPTYDIGHWTRHPHQRQQCPSVGNDEEFYNLFVEHQTIPSVKTIDSAGHRKYFLGLCDCAKVTSWILCSEKQMRHRKSDCIFTAASPSANTSTRVHRKLCDVALLTEYDDPYNCSAQMANQQPYHTKGSIYSPRRVCGIAQNCAANQVLEGVEKQRSTYQESYRKDDSCQNTSGERMPDSEYRDPAISLRRRLMFLNYDYLEDRDRSFGRGAEFAGSDTVTVDEDIDEDDDEEDDEPYDDPEEETENEEDGDVWDDDGELAENDEDDASNTESSESDEYVRRARDPNTKKTGLRWANERLSRFARSNNPSGSFSHRKRQDEQESGGSDEGGCDEPEDGSGMDGPLQYVDYESADASDQQGRAGMDNGDEGDTGMAGVGQPAKPHILYHLSICIGIALCI